MIKKESPNEGTETPLKFCIVPDDLYIKKESPNEGTETIASMSPFVHHANI